MMMMMMMMRKMMMKTVNEEDDDDEDATHYILTQLPFLCVPSAHKTINQVTSLAIIWNENIIMIIMIFITLGGDDDEPTYS